MSNATREIPLRRRHIQIPFRTIVRSLFILLAAVSTSLAGGVSFGGFQPVNGDVIFQSLSGSPLVKMIEGTTSSAYSHCGIVENKNGDWLVIEAVGPVRETPLADWIRQGRDGGFAAYRLKSGYTSKIDQFLKAASEYIGLPYDIRYEMDDQKLYCSELVFKAFRKAAHEDLGQLVKLKDLNWQPYRATIESIEGGPVPLEREIITPVNLARAQQLELVYETKLSREAR